MYNKNPIDNDKTTPDAIIIFFFTIIFFTKVKLSFVCLTKKRRFAFDILF